MKSYTVVATFPTLPAAVAQQAAVVEASGFPVAVNRALDRIMRRDGVKGRQVERLTLQVTCHGRVEKS